MADNIDATQGLGSASMRGIVGPERFIHSPQRRVPTPRSWGGTKQLGHTEEVGRVCRISKVEGEIPDESRKVLQNSAIGTNVDYRISTVNEIADDRNRDTTLAARGQIGGRMMKLIETTNLAKRKSRNETESYRCVKFGPAFLSTDTELSYR